MPCLPPSYHKLAEQVQPAVIGELNNVYSDTRASFAYGNRADSSITVWFNADGPDGPTVDGRKTVDNQSEHQEAMNGRTGAYSRQLLSNFQFVRYFKQSWCLGLPSGEETRAENWIGSVDDSRKQRGTLRVCPRHNLNVTTHYVPGAYFRRDRNAAVDWQGGASAFGLGFSVRSGFSKWVRLAYSFGGRNGKLHYICGSNGQPPSAAPRVFSGARAGM